jgi:hypothetical protein
MNRLPVRARSFAQPLLLSLLGAALLACSDSGSSSGGTVQDAGADVTTSDAGTDTSAPVDASPTADAGAPQGTDCVFNSECATGLRCQDPEFTCQPGARGTGQVGVTTCTTGNDCASGVCVEGPSAAFVCSGPCDTNAQCGGLLPRCVNVALLGKICARTPPDAGP